MSKSQMLALIQLIAECHEAELTEARAAMIENDLRGFPLDQINAAWTKYRSIPTNRRMPTAAELIQHIPDGHPTVQEAWAMLPRNEDDSVIWTEEMRSSYGVVRAMILEGNNGAFFAFKSTYEPLVLEARALRKKPNWSPSFGFNKSGREAALVEAIEKKRLSLETSLKYYPELEYSPNYETLALTYGGKDILKISHENKGRLKQLTTIKQME